MSQISLLEFADKMNEVMPTVMKEFARRQVDELYKGKITLPQFLILEYLHHKGESRMTDLANFMHVTTAAMTGIGDRLVRSGYLVRAYDSEDRRIIRVRLTAKGTELVKKVAQQRRQMVLKIFGKISASDRQDYLRILVQIKDILVQGNGELG
ncbi:MAG: MarR family transcriptional regulator [Candidatus Omnitrophota bacterium]|nr:MarR family transcriptional regulator [Candidatus Omnitrophota bacterium]